MERAVQEERSETGRGEPRRAEHSTELARGAARGQSPPLDSLRLGATGLSSLSASEPFGDSIAQAGPERECHRHRRDAWHWRQVHSSSTAAPLRPLPAPAPPRDPREPAPDRQSATRSTRARPSAWLSSFDGDCLYYQASHGWALELRSSRSRIDRSCCSSKTPKRTESSSLIRRVRGAIDVAGREPFAPSD